MAKMTRAAASRYVISVLAEQYGLTPSYFKESDDLRDDWYFTEHSLVELGKAFSRSPVQPAQITPKEIVRCRTISDVVDLVFSKQ